MTVENETARGQDVDAAYRLIAAGADEAGLRYLEEAWRVDPSTPWLDFNLALARWRAGRLHDAWALLGPADNLPPGFRAVWNLHAACLAVDLGWVSYAASLLTPLETAGPRLRWWDNQRQRTEPSRRSIRECLFEITSAASRLGDPLPDAAVAVMGMYGVPLREPEFLAEFQIEEEVAIGTYQVRSVLSGQRYRAAPLETMDAAFPLPQHPGLLTPRFRRDQTLFYDWMSHGTLEEWIVTGQLYRIDPSPAHVIRLGIHLAQALTTAHQAGCVHGRLTPQCIYLTPDGWPRIAFDPVAPPALPGQLEVPDQRPLDPRFTTPHADPASPAGDIASWALCLLAMHLGAVPWNQGQEVQTGLERLPPALAAVLDGALRGAWPTLDEPLAGLTRYYLELTGGSALPEWAEPAGPDAEPALLQLERARQFEATGQPEAALSCCRQALAILSDIVLVHGEPSMVPLWGNSCRQAADWLTVLGHRDEALRWALLAVKLWRTVHEHRPSESAASLAEALLTLARALQGTHPDGALDTLMEAQGAAAMLPSESPLCGLLALEEVKCLQGMGQGTQALTRAAEALATLGEGPSDLHGLLWVQVARGHEAEGRFDEALSACHQARTCWEPAETPQARLQSALVLQLEGDVLVRLQQTTSALERYEQADALLVELPAIPAARQARRVLALVTAAIRAG